jgi:hypothetical protein
MFVIWCSSWRRRNIVRIIKFGAGKAAGEAS